MTKRELKTVKLIQKRLKLIIHFLRTQNEKCLEYGAGAAFFCLEPESAPEPRTSRARAAQKSGGSATLK